MPLVSLTKTPTSLAPKATVKLSRSLHLEPKKSKPDTITHSPDPTLWATTSMLKWIRTVECISPQSEDKKENGKVPFLLVQQITKSIENFLARRMLEMLGSTVIKIIQIAGRRNRVLLDR